MEKPRQGDIWWADLPDPAGRRPVLVLTRSAIVDLLANVTVAPLTRTMRGIASEVVLEPSQGVPTRCAVSLDNLLTVPKNCLSSKITSLSAETMNAVCEAIHFALDLPY
jgi:mRNA interferase MazF